MPHSKVPAWRKRFKRYRWKLPLLTWITHPSQIHILAALPTVVVYSLVKWLYSFLSSVFITQYRYPYMLSLTFAQEVLTLLAFGLFCALGIINWVPFSLHLCEPLLVPSISEATQAFLALRADARSPVGLYSITMRLLPVACMAWSWVFNLGPLLSIKLALLLTVVTLTSAALTAAYGSLWFEPLLCVYAPLSLFLQSLYLCSLAKVDKIEQQSKERRVSSLHLYFTMTVNKILVLGFLCLLHPKSSQVLSKGSWHSLYFLGYLLGVLLLGALQRLLLAMTVLHFSPLAAALMHITEGLATSFACLF